MEVKNNDQKILELKKQIEEKKKLVNKSQRFTPITNCSIELDGTRYNIHTLNRTSAISLLVKLGALLMSAINLGLEEEYVISGYKVNDWLEDIKAKMENINRAEEENKLRAMESKLDQLLSNEKKVELELGEIEAMLK